MSLRIHSMKTSKQGKKYEMKEVYETCILVDVLLDPVLILYP